MSWQDLDCAISFNYCRLALHVLRMAVSDAKYGDRNCREWLRGEGAYWADSLGLEPDVLIEWIDSLPKPMRRPRKHKIRVAPGQLELDFSQKELVYGAEQS